MSKNISPSTLRYNSAMSQQNSEQELYQQTEGNQAPENAQAQDSGDGENGNVDSTNVGDQESLQSTETGETQQQQTADSAASPKMGAVKSGQSSPVFPSSPVQPRQNSSPVNTPSKSFPAPAFNIQPASPSVQHPQAPQPQQQSPQSFAPSVSAQPQSYQYPAQPYLGIEDMAAAMYKSLQSGGQSFSGSSSQPPSTRPPTSKPQPFQSAPPSFSGVSATNQQFQQQSQQAPFQPQQQFQQSPFQPQQSPFQPQQSSFQPSPFQPQQQFQQSAYPHTGAQPYSAQPLATQYPAPMTAHRTSFQHTLSTPQPPKNPVPQQSSSSSSSSAPNTTSQYSSYGPQNTTHSSAVIAQPSQPVVPVASVQNAVVPAASSQSSDPLALFKSNIAHEPEAKTLEHLNAIKYQIVIVPSTKTGTKTVTENNKTTTIASTYFGMRLSTVDANQHTRQTFYSANDSTSLPAFRLDGYLDVRRATGKAGDTQKDPTKSSYCDHYVQLNTPTPGVDMRDLIYGLQARTQLLGSIAFNRALGEEQAKSFLFDGQEGNPVMRIRVFTGASAIPVIFSWQENGEEKERQTDSNDRAFKEYSGIVHIKFSIGSSTTITPAGRFCWVPIANKIWIRCNPSQTSVALSDGGMGEGLCKLLGIQDANTGEMDLLALMLKQFLLSSVPPTALVHHLNALPRDQAQQRILSTNNYGQPKVETPDEQNPNLVDDDSFTRGSGSSQQRNFGARF